jgi:hypothetical protein
VHTSYELYIIVRHKVSLWYVNLVLLIQGAISESPRIIEWLHALKPRTPTWSFPHEHEIPLASQDEEDTIASKHVA